MPGFKYERYNKVIKKQPAPVPLEVSNILTSYMLGVDSFRRDAEETRRRWEQNDRWISADGRLFRNKLQAGLAADGFHQSIGLQNCKGLRDFDE